MDPNDYGPDDRSGHYDCLDGSFLDVVLEEGTGIYDIVVSGIEVATGRTFVYTSHPVTNISDVDRKIKRCTG